MGCFHSKQVYLGERKKASKLFRLKLFIYFVIDERVDKLPETLGNPKSHVSPSPFIAGEV